MIRTWALLVCMLLPMFMVEAADDSPVVAPRVDSLKFIDGPRGTNAILSIDKAGRTIEGAVLSPEDMAKVCEHLAITIMRGEHGWYRGYPGEWRCL